MLRHDTDLSTSRCVYSREYLRQNCEWKYVEIMSHADLTVYSGSTHQADRRCIRGVRLQLGIFATKLRVEVS